MSSWRGWGTLPFFAIGALAGLTALFAKLSGTNLDGITWQAIPAFLIVGSALCFWGRHLNITGPAKKFTAQNAQHDAEVDGPAMTASHLNPEQPAFTEEEKGVLKHKQNRYTMLFLPIQWWGILLPILGIVITVANMTRSN